MDRIPVILDTDPGVDDALALMLALRSPELDVLGLCTVSGNVPVDLGTRNALRVLGLMGRTDVPVFRGADRPLKRDPVYATAVHGVDGLGGAVLPDPAVEARDGAVDFLIETLTLRPHAVTVVAVGPLTNLARAEARAPGVLKRARQVIAMGGAISEPGNSAPTAEFNFFADPHAAQAVIRSGAALTLAPLDATHQVGVTGSVVAERIAPLQTPEAQFVAAAVRPVLALGEKRGGQPVVHLHDPLAVAVALAPALFQMEMLSLDVETEGLLTLGQVVADRRASVLEGKRMGRPVNCVMGVHVEALLRLFLARTLGIANG